MGGSLMKQLLNVLYVLTEDSYFSRQGETICVKVGGDEKVRIPIHTIESIVCFGNTTVSTTLIAFCGERGIGLTFLSAQGKYYGRVEGPISGNVLLRTTQYHISTDLFGSSRIAEVIVTGKIANSRNILLRASREQPDSAQADKLKAAANQMTLAAKQLEKSAAESVDFIRGVEGIAANEYFGAFDSMIKVNRQDFHFTTRSKHPPQDTINALLSYLYMLLKNDIVKARRSSRLRRVCPFTGAWIETTCQ
jgi:CRISPR-associated protein Cas1